MLLKNLLNEWLYENHYINIKDNTILRYQCAIENHIINEIGDFDVDSINPRNLQHFINGLRNTISYRTNKPLSCSTINTVIVVLKLAFEYANDFEITNNNPTLKIKRITGVPKKEVLAFSRDEQKKIERFIDNLNNDEYFGIMLVLYTGLRLGELLALTWNDINLKSGTLFIRKTKYKMKEGEKWINKIGTPKSDKSNRDIPLPHFIKEKLIEMKKKKISKYVVAKITGEPIDQKLYVYRYRMMLKRAHVRQLNFHALRHTFATRALENKMDIKTLSEILGHSSVATTLNIYAHSLPEHKRQQMQKMKKLS